MRAHSAVFALTRVSLLALAAGTAGVAAAQEQDEEVIGLEEIVVTAQRRAESVQDVPIAISAFTAGELETRNITETLDLVQYVPNVFGSNNTGLGSANAYYIRGIGNTESIATFDPPVGSYIDDVYISRQNANNFSFFDVERVEVLRGPQGTLFGRNTTGGAVNVILKQPGEDFGGFIEGGYGRYDKKLLRASVDMPLADGTIALKLSGFWQDSDGYVKNTTTGDRLNDDDGSGVRIGVKLNATDKLTWNFALAKMVSEGENILNFECNPSNSSDCKGRFVTTGLRETFTSGSQFAPLAISGRKANFDQGNKTDTWLVTSNIEWAGDNITFNAITGYVDLKQQFALDFFDGRGGPNLAFPNPIVRGFVRGGFTIVNDGSHKQFTQEFKLTGKLFDNFIDYVAGVYFYDEDNATDFADVFSIFTGAPGGTGLLLADRLLANKTNADAAYAQFDIKPTDQLTLTAGIRYTNETKTFSISDNRASCNDGTIEATCVVNANLVATNGRAIPRKQSAKLWTPRFAVNYDLNEDFLLFASATRGFKSGGWNARGTAASELLPFGPEKVWSYEGGLKSEWFDRRLRVNLTGFYIDVAGLQTPSAFIRPNGSIAFITRNFADYENYGLELELSAVPVDGLNVYANLGWQDDTYKIDRNAPAFDEFGVQSVAAQQAACLAQLAAGRIAGATGADNATSCGAGIISPDGSIAEPVRTPDLSLSAGASYEIPFGSAGISLTPSVNVSYRSKTEVGTSNLSIFTGSVTGPSGTVYPANPISGDFITGSRSGGNVLVNASLALKTDDDAWLVSVECDNCLNEAYVQSALGNYSYLNAPMTWMLRARRKF
jgi:iron complex outermembrane receptor protein